MKRIIALTGIALTLVIFVGDARAKPQKIDPIDVDEHLTDPVPHRYIHGRLGDANFQMALPDDWNGELLIGARGFSGNEFSSGSFKTVGLMKGYAYALSDQGWYRYDIIDHPEDKYFESRRRIHQLTKHAKATVKSHYGQAASRTFMVGGSNGGHNTKMMVEDYPSDYDGGIAGYGISSHIEWLGSCARFLRNYDVIEPRIGEIMAERITNPNWDPATEPLTPPLTPAQIEALYNIYNMPATITNHPQKPGDGVSFNIGRFPGSEYRWPGRYGNLYGYVETSLEKFDPTYDPNGDGVISPEELKAWDPNESPPQVQNDFRRFDNTGNLQRPVIIGHGADDTIVSPGETKVYKQLVKMRFGVAGALDVLAVYWIPGMGHGGAEFNAWIDPALDALEDWVDYRESGGTMGSPPPANLGGYDRDTTFDDENDQY